MSLAAIDVGGTSIKFALHAGGEELALRSSVPTPPNLDGLYEALAGAVAQIGDAERVDGVAISSPGAVDQATGIIGGASAVPYIHGFPIVDELERRLGMSVSIENDANCAALAETVAGAARDVRDAVLLVLGTGVGGAVVIDGKVRRGRHLLGGEFGYMLHDASRTVSDVGTIVGAARRYNQAHGTALSGRELFEFAHEADADGPHAEARAAVEEMCRALAVTIFNLQFSIDPDCFVIGGGISRNPSLPTDIESALDEVMASVPIAEVRPDIRIARFQADANLLGAVFNFQQRADRKGGRP